MKEVDECHRLIHEFFKTLQMSYWLAGSFVLCSGCEHKIVYVNLNGFHINTLCKQLKIKREIIWSVCTNPRMNIDVSSIFDLIKLFKNALNVKFKNAQSRYSEK